MNQIFVTWLSSYAIVAVVALIAFLVMPKKYKK